MATSDSPESDRPTGSPDKRTRSEKWADSRPDRPRMSKHVVGDEKAGVHRWDERTPWWSASPEYAYDCGVPVFELKDEVFSDADGRVNDRVRVFGENRDGEIYGVIMFIRGGVVTTVYRLGDANLSPPVKSYLWTLLAQQGHLDPLTEPHEGCQE